MTEMFPGPVPRREQDPTELPGLGLLIDHGG
jgi:hypothetical protein